MPGKDDPLQSARPGYRTESRTLFLEREGMLEARENFWRAFHEHADLTLDGGLDRRTWDIAFAAAVAAFDFLMSGRIQPK